MEAGQWTSGDHTVTVSAYDDAGNRGSSSVKVSGPSPDWVAPTIAAVSAPATVAVGTTAAVSADVFDNRSVASALLFYRAAGSSDDFRIEPMSPGPGGRVSASIPRWDVTLAGIEYFVWASDWDGNMATSPSLAPADVAKISARRIGTSLAIKVTPTAVSYGGACTVSVILKDEFGRPLVGRGVALDYRAAGVSTWSSMTTTATGASGLASLVFRPQKNTTYRARFVASGDYAASASSNAVVSAKVYLSAAKTSRLGTRYYRLYGTIKPAHASSKAVRIYRWRYVSGKWKPYSYVYCPASSYTYSVKYKFPYAGKWRVQVVHPADPYNSYNKTLYTVFYVK